MRAPPRPGGGASAVRDAIQTAHVETLQGIVSFDRYGDINDRTISLFQLREDSKYPLDAVLHQYKYLGVAPNPALNSKMRP